MPVYELEILEPKGGVTRGEHVPPAGASYDVHDSFEYEGRRLCVRLIEKTDCSDTDERLICVVEQAAGSTGGRRTTSAKPLR